MKVTRIGWSAVVLALAVGGCRSCNESPPGASDDAAAMADAGGGPSDAAATPDAAGSADGPPAQVEVEQPPASLGPDGIVVEQPKAGETVHGAWVSVTGWVDPKRWPSVVASGAPAAGFYVTTSGHLGIPTVPVRMRADGRFVAPRVPLADGMVEIPVVPLGSAAGHAPPQTVRRTVMASDTATLPASVTATPSSGGAPLVVTFRAQAGGEAGGTWEWDWNNDATSDEADDGNVTHAFDKPGVYPVTARRRGEGGRWIYAVVSVSVVAPSELLDQATVAAPAALAVVTDHAAWNAGLTDDGVVAGGDDTALTRAVLVADGNAVQVFDAHLKPGKSLGGLSGPRGVAGDAQGRVYVADTGNDRLVRFAPDGSLDTTFGTKGVIDATLDGTRLKRPTALALGYGGTAAAPRPLLLLADSGNDRLVVCAGEPMACSAIAPRIERDDVADAAPVRVSAIAARGDLDDLLFAPPRGPFPAYLADSTRLLAWSRSKAGAHFDVVGTLATPLVSLGAAPARSLHGMSVIVGLDGNGLLHEWLAGSQRTLEARRESPPFGATVLALDPYATAHRWNQWRKTPDLAARLESGPVVVYLAGAGTVQRRVLSSIEALPW